jgi:cell division septal protein FtsQ
LSGARQWRRRSAWEVELACGFSVDLTSSNSNKRLEKLYKKKKKKTKKNKKGATKRS